jgi:ABC-2 type transport system permease protein
MTHSDTPVRQSSAEPAHRPSTWARARAVWASRRILRILVIRDLKVRYSSSVLGYVWTLLDPLLLSLVYWIVFGFIIARGSANEQPYLLWLLLGILPFQWTSHVLNDCGRLLGNDAKLVTSSSLPREIWPVRTVLSRFIEFLFTLPITFGVMFLYRNQLQSPGPQWWVLLVFPLAFFVQGIFNTGLALMFAPLSMLYPDMQRLIRVFTTLYRYLSPVVYGVVTLEAALKNPAKTWPSWMLFGDQTWPSWLLTLFELNPLAGILDVYHAFLFADNSLGLTLLPLATAISVAIFFVGWWIFRRLESRVLKEM